MAVPIECQVQHFTRSSLSVSGALCSGSHGHRTEARP